MPTMEVIPMTTPSTVRPERSLLPRTVWNAIETTSPRRPTRIAIYSRLNASMGSRAAARMAG